MGDTSLTLSTLVIAGIILFGTAILAIAKHRWSTALISASLVSLMAHLWLALVARETYAAEYRPKVSFSETLEQANTPAPADSWATILPGAVYDVGLYVAFALAFAAAIVAVLTHKSQLTDVAKRTLVYFGSISPTASDPTRHLVNTKHTPQPEWNNNHPAYRQGSYR